MNKFLLGTLLVACFTILPMAYAIPCPSAISPPNAQRVYNSCGQYAVFQQNGLYGFSERHSGKVVVPAQYEAVFNYYANEHSPTAVKRKGKWGFVNMKGRVIVPFKYDTAQHFGYGGTPAIVSINGKWGMVGTQGQTVVPLNYERMDGFNDNFAVACKSGKCGFFDHKGNQAIDLIYDDAGSFGNGIAPVKQNDKWGYIDTKGKTVIPFEYDQAAPFQRDWAGIINNSCLFVIKNGQEMAIDATGKVLQNSHQRFGISNPAPCENHHIYY